MSHPDNGVDAMANAEGEVHAFIMKRTARPLRPRTDTAQSPQPVRLWKSSPGDDGQPQQLQADPIAALSEPSRINIRSTDLERLLILCALRHPQLGRIDPSLIARTAQPPPPALDHWYNAEIIEQSPKADKARRILNWALSDPAAQQQAEDFLGRQLAAAVAVGAQLTTALDADYPANLRLVPDAPPFLFHRGHLDTADARSIAVVGTREATADGRARAARMARSLSDAGVVVVSGLARGIDTAAHSAALDRNQRTVAVVGAGIAAKIYPPENTPLAERIINGGGAIVSQFWPTDPPDQWRFPARNITMSGYSQGTVVIEASSTSGAKLQAQAARRHGRTVFLLHSLATTQSWAQKMIEDARAELLRPQQLDLIEPQPTDSDLPLAVVEVDDVDDVISRVADAHAVRAAANLRHELAYAWPAA